MLMRIDMRNGYQTSNASYEIIQSSLPCHYLLFKCQCLWVDIDIYVHQALGPRVTSPGTRLICTGLPVAALLIVTLQYPTNESRCFHPAWIDEAENTTTMPKRQASTGLSASMSWYTWPTRLERILRPQVKLKKTTDHGPHRKIRPCSRGNPALVDPKRTGKLILRTMLSPYDFGHTTRGGSAE